jgi:hypothetical protein
MGRLRKLVNSLPFRLGGVEALDREFRRAPDGRDSGLVPVSGYGEPACRSGADYRRSMGAHASSVGGEAVNSKLSRKVFVT